MGILVANESNAVFLQHFGYTEALEHSVPCTCKRVSHIFTIDFTVTVHPQLTTVGELHNSPNPTGVGELRNSRGESNGEIDGEIINHSMQTSMMMNNAGVLTVHVSG